MEATENQWLECRDFVFLKSERDLKLKDKSQ